MDLSVKYMGLDLCSPIIIGSSGLTNTVEKVVELEKYGVGAVILKSLFEEQILFEAEAASIDQYDYPETIDYVKSYTKDNSINKYLNLIRDCKKETNIPIIASINCVTNGKWTEFAKKIEDVGADAIEINVSVLPFDINRTSEDSEKVYFNILDKINALVKIPIALKLSHYSANIAHLVQQLSWRKQASAFVLFNRFYNPDIDINTKKITSSGVFTKPSDITMPLRWIALLSNEIKTDLSASTGVHSGADIAKLLLAGASSVQIVSSIYQNGPAHINKMLNDLIEWMKKNNYTSINDFKGIMNAENAHNSVAFERIQFMKYFGGIE